MDKMWAVFFGVVLLGCFLLCVAAPFAGWWLPEQVSSYGGDIDFLFYLILGLTAFFFILTEVLLVWFMFRYAERPGQKAVYVEGNTRLELLWSAVPAALLIFIAVVQIYAWERIKYQSKMPNSQGVDQVVQVTGRQWEWRMRYTVPDDLKSGAAAAGTLLPASAVQWAEAPEADDVRDVNDFHTWKDANVRIYLKTQDVIHSFFLPNLRLKQDALPGKTIPMWFKATDWNTRFDEATGRLVVTEGREWELACAELCGSRHYAMRGRLYVHKSKESYLAWLKHASDKQRSRDAAPSRPAAD